MKTVLRIDDQQGGMFSLTYKLLNLHPDEKFRISIDGVSVLLDNKNIKGDFTTFNHSMKGNAEHTIDFALLSDFREYNQDF